MDAVAINDMHAFHFSGPAFQNMLAIEFHSANQIGRKDVRKRTFGYEPNTDSDQPAHSRILMRIFTGRTLDSQAYGCNVSSDDAESED